MIDDDDFAECRQRDNDSWLGHASRGLGKEERAGLGCGFLSLCEARRRKVEKKLGKHLDTIFRLFLLSSSGLFLLLELLYSRWLCGTLVIR